MTRSAITNTAGEISGGDFTVRGQAGEPAGPDSAAGDFTLISGFQRRPQAELVGDSIFADGFEAPEND